MARCSAIIADQKRERIRQMLESGASVKETAYCLGYRSNWVYQTATALGFIPMRVSQAERKMILQFRKRKVAA